MYNPLLVAGSFCAVLTLLSFGVTYTLYESGVMAPGTTFLFGALSIALLSITLFLFSEYSRIRKEHTSDE